MNEFLLLITAAILIEAIVQTVKLATEKGLNKWYLTAFAVGIFVSVIYGLDLFGLLGFTSPILPAMAATIVGSVLTGVIFGRGANFFHDLLKRLNGGE